MTTIPTRFVNLPAAKAQFGDRVDRLAPFLMQGDPLADDVIREMEQNPNTPAFALLDAALKNPTLPKSDLPPALATYLAEMERVPAWVDFEGMKKGSELFQRASTLGAFTLATASLVLGYASPAGNKPLIFSGRLLEMAPRRLAETSRFVQATAQEGGLKRTGDAFAITLKVRLMHAKVRRMLQKSPAYQTQQWGEPINQHDMAATTLLFSLAFLEGLRTLGLDIAKQEAESFMHLWRYAGYLSGVSTDLLPTSEFDAWSLANLIKATQAPPDEDSRALTKALFEGALGRPQTPADQKAATLRKEISQAICRGLIGNDLANALNIPKTPHIATFHAIRTLTRLAEQARKRSNKTHQIAIKLGSQYWEKTVAQSLNGKPADFTPPTHLHHAA